MSILAPTTRVIGHTAAGNPITITMTTAEKLAIINAGRSTK